MSRRCDVCHRKPKTVVSRSHSNIATKRKQFLNLQNKTIGGKRIKICSRCLKTMAKKAK
ncbi:MAG: 50S ribosomal protein L28 [Patescibacteria group bacterium]|nr:50S ribosomal protein L28 [Patescibacteria group bacterium]MDD5490184.1 50S ribosomal protein L28 [Patescibacteria group bacterium]